MSLVFPERIGSSGQIEYPSYTVYFDVGQNNKKATTLEKVQVCTQRSLQLVGIFFVSSKDALFRTLGSAGTSFKYTVLGYYGSWSQIRFPENAHLIVFKIVFWTASMGWGIVATTSRLFLERASTGHSLFLEQFASDEIDVDHIKTEELSLDASHVPETIQVDTLLELFDAINFTDPTAPGYMAETACQEEDKTFTQEELRVNINNFIHRVNTREAFIGTPPAHDVPRLMDFYQQIEDAVRLSIHKARENVTDFEEGNKNASGSFSYNELAEDKKREYKNLLETRARVALDLAIAGAHCGARYMGEAMDVYYNIYNEEGIPNDKDLQGTLIEILAKKREEIAKEEAQKLGLDDATSDTTHQFTKYMGNMGRLLGIPGTKNIIEHLSKSIDTYKLLDDFFQKYTVDTIINAVQEKIKTSQDFREKIIDWLKDQVEDWNHEKYQGFQEQVRQGDFLDFLYLEEIFTKILSIPSEDLTDTENRAYQRLIEWILVSQKILKPQIESSQNKVVGIDLSKNQARSYARTMHEAPGAKNLISLDKLVNLLRNREESVEEIFPRISTPDTRHREETLFKRDAVLTWIFKQSFQENPDRVVAAAENVSRQVFYPRWKKVCLIQLPKVPAGIFCNTYFKIALTASAIFFSAFSIYQAHARVSELFAAKGIPFIINHVPVQVIRAGNAIIGAKELIWRNRLKVIAITWLTRERIVRLPEIPYLSAAARSIDLWEIFNRLFSSPQTIFGFALSRSLSIIGSVWNASQEIGQRFRKISSNAEKERDITYRQKSLGVWKNCQVALA